LKSQIKALKKELADIKFQSQKLILENSHLKNYLDNERKKNNALQIEIKKNVNSDKIVDLYKRIDDLKEKLSRYPCELSYGEKLMSVIITSQDQKIHFSIICKNTTTFNRIEEKIYKDYPEFLEIENYFLVNGNKINKYKTMEENHIKNSDIIILHQLDF